MSEHRPDAICKHCGRNIDYVRGEAWADYETGAEYCPPTMGGSHEPANQYPSNQYPSTRYASPQAWRRFRKQTTEGERADMARDIATVLAAEMGTIDNLTLESAIEFALSDYEWEGKAQI